MAAPAEERVALVLGHLDYGESDRILRLLIAQEHTSLGHTLEALDEARRCAHEAVADPALRNGPAIVARCDEIVRTMEPRVSRHAALALSRHGELTLAMRTVMREIQSVAQDMKKPAKAGFSVSSQAIKPLA